MDSKSDSIEIMICDKAGEVIEECFEKALFRYQVGLETSMKSYILILQIGWKTKKTRISHVSDNNNALNSLQQLH